MRTDERGGKFEKWYGKRGNILNCLQRVKSGCQRTEVTKKTGLFQVDYNRHIKAGNGQAQGSYPKKKAQRENELKRDRNKAVGS